MNSRAFYSERELSLPSAWANAFLKLQGHAGLELSPFSICIENKDKLVVPDSLTHPMVIAIDKCLEEMGEKYQSVEKIAFTIFPDRLWKVMDGNRQDFYKEYLLNQPSYVSWNSHKNHCGLYFGRLIAFGIDHKTNMLREVASKSALGNDGNQIEHIISQCKKGSDKGTTAPRMQLQAAVFDPFRDATKSGQPSFPCLQHVTFDPDTRSKTLAMNAFYATQQLFVKAYGNWLGLCRLGEFVASQTNLTFNRFTCFVGVQKMSEAPKRGASLDALTLAAREVATQCDTVKQAVVNHAR